MGSAAPIPGLHPPHPPRVPAKVRVIASMYADGEHVPPVVGIRFGSEVWAISGSHRIAAMGVRFRTIDEAEQAGALVIIESEKLIKAAERRDDNEALFWLKHRERWNFFPEILKDLWPYLPNNAKEALRDDERIS